MRSRLLRGRLRGARYSDARHNFSAAHAALLRLMNKDLGLILAAAVGAQMPATRAAFQVNAAQLSQGQEQGFSAVILEMEKQAHLGSVDNRRTRVIRE